MKKTLNVNKLMVGLLLIFASFGAIAADVDAGKARYAMCAGCHGVAGESAVPTYPNLAGQKEAYTVKQLKAFKDGTRTDPTMNAMSAPLNDADMENIAAYLGGL